MLSKYGTPYLGGAFCTDRMKTTPFKKYCDEHFDGYTVWLGMRVDEPKRIKKRKGFKYLADISDFDKDDILNWWGQQEFDLDIDEHLGNCVFCIKKSTTKVALAIKDEELKALKFIKMLDDNSVRKVKTRIGSHLIMYRGNNTLEQIYETCKDIPRSYLFNKLRGAKTLNSGCGSESCEPFNLDLFKESKE